MKTDNFKNIVILKDIPSNIVEEAIVVLKPNTQLEHVENKININNSKIKSKDYILNEAQNVISNYISKTENVIKQKNIKNTLQYKYNILKIITLTLIAAIILKEIFKF